MKVPHIVEWGTRGEDHTSLMPCVRPRHSDSRGVQGRHGARLGHVRDEEGLWGFTHTYALSVRPGSFLAISAHLLPSDRCSFMMMPSSFAVHGPFLMPGLSWLCHRSRHCLPLRPLSFAATVAQLPGPCLRTIAATLRSSSWVQDFFTCGGGMGGAAGVQCV